MASETKPIRVPPGGTKGSGMLGGRFLAKLAKPFLNSQVARYRKAEGPEPAKFMGFPILLLTTVGARTGAEHTHVLGGFPDGEDAWLVIASKGGAATHPPAHPQSTIACRAIPGPRSSSSPRSGSW